MSSIEHQIAEWRDFVSSSRVVDEADADELEGHLRDQIADLNAVGLSEEEAFLVAVRRMGSIDAVSREFAREHSDRLWKQLVLDSRTQAADGLSIIQVVLFALAGGAAIHLPRLFGTSPEDADASLFYLRNASLLVLPVLALFLGRRHRLPRRYALTIAALFVIAALGVNVYPWPSDSWTEALAVIHLPVALWFLIGVTYSGGDWRSNRSRMDFVRFTGESFIYYVLIALGGGVLVGLAALILDPLGTEAVEVGIKWVLMSGAAGAFVVVAWLAEAKQSVIENMAPVLTKIFTPLFALLLGGSAIAYAVSGLAGDFDRELLAVFDVLMVVVLGLVLYGLSAADTLRPPGLLERFQLVAVVSALILDLMVLGSMVLRVADFGLTPNRVAALGLNLVLLVNLVGTAWLLVKALRHHRTLERVERWQMRYLPVFGAWAAAVALVLPPMFGFE